MKGEPYANDEQKLAIDFTIIVSIPIPSHLYTAVYIQLWEKFEIRPSLILLLVSCLQACSAKTEAGHRWLLVIYYANEPVQSDFL